MNLGFAAKAAPTINTVFNANWNSRGRNIGYLFKLKQTANVKRLIERQWRQSEWCGVGQGWQACEDSLKLTGWSRARRVIVMRHAVKGELLVEPGAKRRGRKSAKGKDQDSQQSLVFVDQNEPAKIWEYAVLVTNSPYGIEHMGQLYRDRADCENGFDEMKNQWGWGGYSTQDIERCNLSAQTVALAYNWWSWYVRLANPKARMKAILCCLPQWGNLPITRGKNAYY